MSKSDQWVIIAICVLILLYLSTLVIGNLTGRFSYLSAFLNAFTGASIILYWTIKQIQIEQHIIETREIIVLLFEVLMVGAAVYYVAGNQRHNWLRVMQCIFFGIHLAALLLGLIFMFTFKINKLM
jgi:hypothetical protein